MKAVDILIAARARLSKKENWTTGNLVHESNHADDGRCFCSLGAVLNAGGGFSGLMNLFEKAVTNAANNARKENKLLLARENDRCHSLYYRVGIVTDKNSPVSYPSINDDLERELVALGFKTGPTMKAIEYLQSASRQVTGLEVVQMNDVSISETNHKLVLMVFDQAIKNAKRRVIGGSAQDKKYRHKRAMAAKIAIPVQVTA